MSRNIVVKGSQPSEPVEAQVTITENDGGLVIAIDKHLECAGAPTYKRGDDGKRNMSQPTGNVTLASSHGFVMLPSGCELTFTLFKRGSRGNASPRANIKIT